MNKEKFITITSNWDSHRPLLWAGLEAIKHLKLPILELGCGNGSTPFLREYCKDNDLELFSYDYNQDWAKKFDVPHVSDWENIPWRKEYGLALVDESPGEHRKISLSRLHHVKVVIAHDTEPAADHGYRMRAELKKYRYLIDYETNGAWATGVSNFINVTKFEI
jgi:hypothetical protein